MQLLLCYQKALKQGFGVILRIKHKNRIEELPVCQQMLCPHQQVIQAQQECISRAKQFVLRPLCLHNLFFQGFTLDQIWSGPQIKYLPHMWFYISQRTSQWYRLQCPHRGLKQTQCKPTVKSFVQISPGKAQLTYAKTILQINPMHWDLLLNHVMTSSQNTIADKSLKTLFFSDPVSSPIGTSQIFDHDFKTCTKSPPVNSSPTWLSCSCTVQFAGPIAPPPVSAGLCTITDTSRITVQIINQLVQGNIIPESGSKIKKVHAGVVLVDRYYTTSG